MFNLFKKNQNKDEENLSLIAVTSLLIHSAKIDENYTEKEKNIIIEALIEMGATKDEIEHIFVEPRRKSLKKKKGGWSFSSQSHSVL